MKQHIHTFPDENLDSSSVDATFDPDTASLTITHLTWRNRLPNTGFEERIIFKLQHS